MANNMQQPPTQEALATELKYVLDKYILKKPSNAECSINNETVNATPWYFYKPDDDDTGTQKVPCKSESNSSNKDNLNHQDNIIKHLSTSNSLPTSISSRNDLEKQYKIMNPVIKQSKLEIEKKKPPLPPPKPRKSSRLSLSQPNLSQDPWIQSFEEIFEPPSNIHQNLSCAPSSCLTPVKGSNATQFINEDNTHNNPLVYTMNSSILASKSTEPLTKVNFENDDQNISSVILPASSSRIFKCSTNSGDSDNRLLQSTMYYSTPITEINKRFVLSSSTPSISHLEPKDEKWDYLYSTPIEATASFAEPWVSEIGDVNIVSKKKCIALHEKYNTDEILLYSNALSNPSSQEMQIPTYTDVKVSGDSPELAKSVPLRPPPLILRLPPPPSTSPPPVPLHQIPLPPPFPPMSSTKQFMPIPNISHAPSPYFSKSQHIVSSTSTVKFPTMTSTSRHNSISSLQGSADIPALEGTVNTRLTASVSPSSNSEPSYSIKKNMPITVKLIQYNSDNQNLVTSQLNKNKKIPPTPPPKPKSKNLKGSKSDFSSRFMPTSSEADISSITSIDGISEILVKPLSTSSISLSTSLSQNILSPDIVPTMCTGFENDHNKLNYTLSSRSDGSSSLAQIPSIIEISNTDLCGIVSFPELAENMTGHIIDIEKEQPLLFDKDRSQLKLETLIKNIDVEADLRNLVCLTPIMKEKSCNIENKGSVVYEHQNNTLGLSEDDISYYSNIETPPKMYYSGSSKTNEIDDVVSDLDMVTSLSNSFVERENTNYYIDENICNAEKSSVSGRGPLSSTPLQETSFRNNSDPNLMNSPTNSHNNSSILTNGQSPFTFAPIKPNISCMFSNNAQNDNNKVKVVNSVKEPHSKQPFSESLNLSIKNTHSSAPISNSIISNLQIKTYQSDSLLNPPNDIIKSVITDDSNILSELYDSFNEIPEINFNFVPCIKKKKYDRRTLLRPSVSSLNVTRRSLDRWDSGNQSSLRSLSTTSIPHNLSIEKSFPSHILESKSSNLPDDSSKFINSNLSSDIDQLPEKLSSSSNSYPIITSAMHRPIIRSASFHDFQPLSYLAKHPSIENIIQQSLDKSDGPKLESIVDHPSKKIRHSSMGSIGLFITNIQSNQDIAEKPENQDKQLIDVAESNKCSIMRNARCISDVGKNSCFQNNANLHDEKWFGGRDNEKCKTSRVFASNVDLPSYKTNSLNDYSMSPLTNSISHQTIPSFKSSLHTDDCFSKSSFLRNKLSPIPAISVPQIRHVPVQRKISFKQPSHAEVNNFDSFRCTSIPNLSSQPSKSSLKKSCYSKTSDTSQFKDDKYKDDLERSETSDSHDERFKSNDEIKRRRTVQELMNLYTKVESKYQRELQRPSPVSNLTRSQSVTGFFDETFSKPVRKMHTNDLKRLTVKRTSSVSELTKKVSKISRYDLIMFVVLTSTHHIINFQYLNVFTL